MISAKFLWGNVFIGGKLQIDAKNSNFEIFESTLYMKSVSMPLILTLLHRHNTVMPQYCTISTGRLAIQMKTIL